MATWFPTSQRNRRSAKDGSMAGFWSVSRRFFGISTATAAVWKWTLWSASRPIANSLLFGTKDFGSAWIRSATSVCLKVCGAGIALPGKFGNDIVYEHAKQVLAGSTDPRYRRNRLDWRLACAPAA